ncbi:MAG TPA: flagellar hook-associated protein FlgK [Burkholderiaceae bacterium]|nr:flagellar hook-associated protein FlgK [Burkholderiaceae bacterium]
MNLANLGLSGLTAAQARLMTTGHNINNAATTGYNRQSVLVSTAGATSTSSGYIGRGVQVDGVQRSYDGFLYNQLVDSQSQGAAIASYGNQITQVNNLFGDRTVGLNPALQNFFNGIQSVASTPGDSAARQELLGQAGSLAGQFNSINNFLDAQRQDVNTQVSTVVTQINSYANQVNDLNQQITKALASNPGQPPNDLLDQRDQAVSQLSQLINVKTVEQDNVVSLTVGNGQVLLGGGTVYPLQAVGSAADPSRTVVAYTAVSGPGGATTPVEMDESGITGGSLAGLLSYRSQALDPVQNAVGRMAAGLAMTVNHAHEQGVDLNGNPGKAMFSLSAPKVIPNSANGSTAEITVQFQDLATNPDAAAQLTGQDYKIAFDGTNYTVTRVQDGSQVYSGATLSNQSIDGLSFNLTGSGTAPQAGDSWLVQPTRDTAGGFTLALSDPAQIAAADATGGSANGNNALSLAKLQTDKTLDGGTMSVTDAFSRIVNQVGVMTQQNSASAKAQNTLIQQNYSAQQNVSGVNLNEEYVNLDQFQQQFQAASRLIDVSSTLFDTLLGLAK